MARSKNSGNDKVRQLGAHRDSEPENPLTTNQGLRINDDQNSLKAGVRGPSLLEDFHLREKITHFDHERIPERVVHARGSGAHGVFQVYRSMSSITRAAFLQNPALTTPVFVRFSTVAGSRGSTDLARDVRGFAVKFFTSDGNFDLVGNNIPVFFIQDAVKFPDLVHAVKPEPHHEMPQAASAHDTFWDFISLMPESMHMILWVMSDRAIPRSYRMMEGFGVHTFRLLNAEGKSRFVKFHWKPLLGVHSVAWDEAQKISGKDPDFHRRDLWDAIAAGSFPEYELGLQVVDEADEDKYDFDLLDPTKLIPEEVVPVQRIGKLTLNRNPDNFFAETEQVAFHPGHLVPGIDFSDDPLLQGRLFSYTDTQLLRLGGPNFHEIPINRPIAPIHNNQRDGHMRQQINPGRSSYHPNTLGGGCPFQAKAAQGGFVSVPAPVDSPKVRARGPKFFDHFSQARLFWNSQSDYEKDHLVRALRFELGKVETLAIRERMLGLLSQVDAVLTEKVARGLGLRAPARPELPMNHSVPADGKQKDFEPRPGKAPVERSKALSMASTPKEGIRTRTIALLSTDGFDDPQLSGMKQALEKAGAAVKLVATHVGPIKGAKGTGTIADMSLLTASSVLFDAVFIPGGRKSVETLAAAPDAADFLREAFKHCKTIGALGEGVDLVEAALGPILPRGAGDDPGLVLMREGSASKAAPRFIEAAAQHRHWSREKAFFPEPAPSPSA